MLQDYAVNTTPGQGGNVYTQPLYDTIRTGVVPAGGATFPMFSVPFGSGTSGATGAGPKTLMDTNLQAPGGSLPSPQEQCVAQVRIQLDPTATFADLQVIQTVCFASLVVGSFNWLTLPVISLPACCGISGVNGLAAAVGNVGLTNGWASMSSGFILSIPLRIMSTVNFGLNLVFVAGFTPSAAQAGTIRCYLDGENKRSN